MEQKITQKEVQAVMQLLAKYNVGVQEYAAAEKMFKELPVVVELPVKEVQEESNGNK